MGDLETGAEDDRAGVLRDDFLKRRLRVLDQTSATQVNAWDTCPRYWFNSYVEGLRQPPAPHQARGTHIDLEVQHLLKTGEVRKKPVTIDGKEEEWSELVRAVRPLMPDPTQPGAPEVLVQARIELPTFEGGPVMLGFPDAAYWLGPRGTTLQIDDLKSTSDFRYCKTREQLASDVQIGTVYPRWGYETMGARFVSIAHVYARTRGAKRAHRVPLLTDERLIVSADRVDDQWGRVIEGRLLPMAEAARSAACAEELTPNTESCDFMYGKPCPFCKKCGLEGGATRSAATAFRKKTTTNAQETEMVMTLKERLQAAKDGGRAPQSKAAEPANGAGAKPKKLFCADCGAELTPDNSSKLQSGAMRHIGCAEAAAPTPAPDPEEGAGSRVVPDDAPPRTSTAEDSRRAAEGGKKAKPQKGHKVVRMKIDGVLYDVEQDADFNVVSKTPVEAPKPAEEKKPEAKLVATKPVVKKVESSDEEEVNAEGIDTRPRGSEEAENARVDARRKAAASKPAERKAPKVAPTLYVDCVPSKGVRDAVHLEEWLDPIAETCAKVHVDKDGNADPVADWGLIAYTSRAELAHVMRQVLETCPAAVIIDSRTRGADVAIEVLTPHAAVVVRGIR